MKIAGHYEGCLELQVLLKTKVCYCQAHEVVKQEEARHAACNEQIAMLEERLRLAQIAERHAGTLAMLAVNPKALNAELAQASEQLQRLVKEKAELQAKYDEHQAWRKQDLRNLRKHEATIRELKDQLTVRRKAHEECERYSLHWRTCLGEVTKKLGASETTVRELQKQVEQLQEASKWSRSPINDNY